ncbi:hypothetical protein SLU01_33790 [Sporosarcina luteola]|uniref:RelA/SpoT domain-containing protein n=1 Tax=Sporosarcina luteola TaxID=582850 RepID=A0A511ZC90_9BACL|nr:hypothetical protein [Sporosarcina luteola]GEN85067.1 hypothetical protein SLU01_33790 [Sporosarcina luteola]
MEIKLKIERLLSRMLPVIATINNYEVPDLPSMRKTIDRFSPNLLYDKVIDFFIEKSDEISCIDELISKNNDRRIDISYRLKTEQSFFAKWEKNLGKTKQLREVCNDTIGIRFIVEGSPEEILAGILKVVEHGDYTIDIINMYDKPKAVDDGYRGIHLQFRNNPKCFPLEIQFWTQKDALLHFYTHEIIYKMHPNEESNYYSMSLRNCLENLPEKPSSVPISFETYLYKILHANKGGE